MEVLVLDPSLAAISIIDTFTSLIWTDRYVECGDFEISTPATTESASLATQYMGDDYYLWSKESNHVMIIETAEIKSDLENGSALLISGRSLESILDRRIIWTNTELKGSFQNGVKKLLDENAIAPSIPERKIPNLIFKASDDPLITELEIETQFARGDNLYDSIVALCQTKNVGFRIYLTDANEFEFCLYAGQDRSYDQDVNPYVVFSNDFDNVINTDYVRSKKSFKNVSLVVGEENDETGQKTTVVGNYSGLARRETYTDASSISQTVDDVTMTDEEYLKQLSEKGEETLAETKITEEFDGEMDVYGNFQYGRDFNMGDIVQIKNEYGIETKSRITELILSQDESGFTSYPTFSDM